MSSGTRTRPERKGWEKISFQQHVDRVKKSTPTVDCGPPRPHPLGNRREMEKRRYDNLIELDNSLMLKRLVKAVKGKGIDNEIHKSVAMHQHFNREMGKTKRRMKLKKITVDNNSLLRRIQEVQPTYSRVKWEQDAKRNEHLRKVMTLYPERYKPVDISHLNKKKPLGSIDSNGSLDSSGGMSPYKFPDERQSR